MTKKLYKNLIYFKQERSILALTIDLENQHLVSSAKFVYFVQKQLEGVYHVVIDRAKFHDKFTSENLLVLCCTRENRNYKNYYILECQGSYLTFTSKLKLLENYSKFVESKEIIL
jgi:hypothetical protein